VRPRPSLGDRQPKNATRKANATTMETISNKALGCLKLLQSLQQALIQPTTEERFRNAIPAAELDDEIGRFRVWCSNLGALQRGHSSLDYRLRDSPLLFSNVMKLLQEVQANLSEAIAVIVHQRKPFEELAAETDAEDEDEDGADESDAESTDDDEDDDDDDGPPRTELGMRFAQIVDINDNLFRLSIRIRSPTLRTRGLKAATYKEIDKETDVDVLEQYAEFDRKYLEDAFRDLRAERQSPAPTCDYLHDRLSSAITRRRQQFKYWRRHRAKLAHAPSARQIPAAGQNVEAKVMATPALNALPNLEDVGNATPVVGAKSEFAPKSTIFSGTEVTTHHKSLDEQVDSMSVTSYATTARDLSGHQVDVPSAPERAVHGRDFECPYCFAICPARYGDSQRAWR
jgi:hypothetical protein